MSARREAVLGNGIVSFSSPEKAPLSKETHLGNSLVLQWMGLQASQGPTGSMPEVEEIRSQKPYGIGKKFKKKFYLK